ncbi:hypothetical protein SAMN05421776_11399 [Nocardia farcinica]|uniref:Uncharacterized protein n=1 Tax=Nocardia farcinica TaxID=37329 RepID=A0A0H5PA00_NOCFR|nr:hypothetical protein [Nocardia farcinica]PFW99446.1 hypothetical protein CJ469_05366 [Nocardia farcinica]PFX06857.1 hypothetical protein CJ468_04257 [Nocardia farcinica]CRY84527.1 Uncharacterised protein [Nocardia farcinica]SIT32781.1 hypothetical protein SAMN05421776_11399 [Nocardia farcinica]
MTDARSDPAAPEASLGDLQAEAITLLTRVSRMQRSRPAANGAAAARATDPIDFAEFVTQVMAGVAANRGGVAVLAGRPGSWEADKLRDMLYSTVGEDEWALAEHRTEPVVIPLAIEEVLIDAGEPEEYEPEDRAQEIVRRAQTAGLSVDEWLTRWNGREPVFTRWRPLMKPEDHYDEQVNAVENRHDDAYTALEARYPEDTDYSVYAAEAEQLDAQRDAELAALRERWRRRYQRYATAFEAAVRAKADELGVRVPLEVQVETDPDRTWDARQNIAPGWADADRLAVRLYEHAREVTPTALLTTDEPDTEG